MEKNNIISANKITISEKTADMYFLHKELNNLLEKVNEWNRKYNCTSNNEDYNAHVQDKFFKEAYETFIPFEIFLHSLLEENITSNIHEYNNTL